MTILQIALILFVFTRALRTYPEPVKHSGAKASHP
jgi:hypothetical protein